MPDLQKVDVADVATLHGGTRLLALGVGGEQRGERPTVPLVGQRELERALVALPSRRLER